MGTTSLTRRIALSGVPATKRLRRETMKTPQRNRDYRTRLTPLFLLFFLPLLTGCNFGFFAASFISAYAALETYAIPARSILGSIVLFVINSI